MHKHLKHSYVLENLQHLRSETTFGLLPSQPTNVTNNCLIKLLNTTSMLVANIEKLKGALEDELDQIS